MGSDELSPSFNNVDEIKLVTADRAVGIAFGLLDVDRAIVHGDKPAAHLVDIEKVSSVDAAQNRLVLLHPVKVEYFLGGFRHVACLLSQSFRVTNQRVSEARERERRRLLKSLKEDIRTRSDPE